jgi:iron(III) transport system ATP-binding protein
LILLDEPLSNVDVQMRARLRQEVREILKAEGVTAVFVTHDQEEALSISDCVVVMRDGRIEQIGDPETLYQRPASRFVAEFVAQANFLHARLQDGQWVTEAGVFDVVPGSSFEGATGDLMIRQEDLEFFPDDAGPAVVVDRHFLGRECRYRLRTVSGRILLARTATEQILAPGTRVVLSVAAHKIRLFGAEAAMAGNLAARGD